MTNLGKSLAIAALAVAAGLPLEARAEILLTATDGVNTGSANDLATPGLASFAGTIGSFTTSMDIGAGFPAVGLPTDPILDLTSLDLTTGTTGGILTIALTETGFVGTTVAKLFASGFVGRYVNSTATMSAYLDTTNAPFGTGTLLASGLLDGQTGFVTEPIIAGPYSLTEIVTVTAGANSLASIDAAIIDAPEPASASLLAAALLALGMLGFRGERLHGRDRVGG